MHTMASASEEPLSADGFRDWLPDEWRVTLLLERSHHQWYAVAEDFSVTGVGETQDEAVQESFELLISYLVEFYREGQPFDDARQPVCVPLARKLESKLGALLSVVLRGPAANWPVAREKSLPGPTPDGDVCAVPA